MGAAPKYEFKSKDEALAALAAVKRVAEKPRLRLVDENFVKQADFIKDCSPLVAALCTRRAGKSMGAGLKAFREMKLHPGCTVLYIALTKDSARNIMWKDVLKDINRKHHLNARFIESDLRVILPNGPDPQNPYDGGSEMKLVGMDANKTEMEKVLGGKYRLVIIDEAGSFVQDLYKLVYEHLEPAVADWDGYIVMIGTPTALTFGLFYDVTKTPENAIGDRNPIKKGWSVHRWNTYDNPHMARQWDKQNKRILGDDPNVINLAWYRRMRLGEWVKDEDDKCYKYDRARNYVSELPENAVWTNVLGVDLGFNDASAFVIQSWREHDRNLYTRHAYKKEGMIISDVVERIRWYIDTYHPIKIVVDNASKQAVEEMRQRYDLPLEPAEKRGKAEFIEIMNSEYLLGYIKLTPDSEPSLAPEYDKLIWDQEEKEKRKWVEHEGLPNHCADGALYSFRAALQYRALPKAPELTEEEKIARQEEEEAMALERSSALDVLGFREDDDYDPEALLNAG